jgi:hypothetical protein
MVSSSSSVLASLSIPVSEKLMRDNYHLWHAQVLLVIHAVQLEGFIEGTKKELEKTLEIEKDSKKVVIPNLDHVVWRMCDLQVLTYLVTSLSREVLAGLASNTTAADMWAAISKTFVSQSQARILHLHNQLVATRKGNMLVPVYFSTMCGYVDEMAAAEKAPDDNDIVSYILNGFDANYNSFIEHVNGMTNPINPETLYAHLLDTEAHLVAQKAQRDQKEQYHMLANTAARGGNGGNKQHTRGGHQGVVVALATTTEAAVILVTLTNPIMIINVRSKGS